MVSISVSIWCVDVQKNRTEIRIFWASASRINNLGLSSYNWMLVDMIDKPSPPLIWYEIVIHSALTTLSSAMFVYNIMLYILMGIIAYWNFQINNLLLHFVTSFPSHHVFSSSLSYLFHSMHMLHQSREQLNTGRLLPFLTNNSCLFHVFNHVVWPYGLKK